jgi:peptidoglycan/LPS O-acetylase OafA/YrhL
MVKMIFGQPHAWKTPQIQMLGHLGVILFFVLSGFLITYLLLKEREGTSTISVKNFYIRRVLRIWPLYFLLVISALFLFPSVSFLQMPDANSIYEGNFGLKALLYLVILPNVAVKLFNAVPFIGQAWSIGVEEQFYLAWPWLVKKSKNTLYALIAVIVVYLLILFGLKYLLASNKTNETIRIAYDIWHSFSIDCMAIGGIFAWLHFQQKHKILAFLRNPLMDVGAVVLAIGMIAGGIRFPILQYEIYAVIFGIIILNLSTNSKTVFNLEFKVIDYLGKISYGVYMYHVLCIFISFKLIAVMMGNVSSWLLYPLSIILTILISSISYEFFEKRFIKIKTNFSSIISGDNAKD